MESNWFDTYGAISIATLVAAALGAWMTRAYALRDKQVSDRDEVAKETVSELRAEIERVRQELVEHAEADEAFFRRVERELGRLTGQLENR